MKDLRYAELLNLYGAMLTQKQHETARQYYHLDYSLAEIAENEGVSRQAVHASLRQTQAALAELEEKLRFYAKLSAVRAEIDRGLAAADADAKATLKRIEELI